MVYVLAMEFMPLTMNRVMDMLSRIAQRYKMKFLFDKVKKVCYIYSVKLIAKGENNGN